MLLERPLGQRALVRFATGEGCNGAQELWCPDRGSELNVVSETKKTAAASGALPARSAACIVTRPVPRLMRIALLLKREYRTRSDASRVQTIAATLGIEVTGATEVFVSGTLSPQLYDLLFGADVAGRRTIAEPLSGLVESVSVLPPRS